MKKILTLFAVVGLFAFSGCTDDDNDTDYDTIATTFENGAPYNFVPSNNENNNFRARFTFPARLFEGDMVLVYRLAGKDSSGRDAWEFLPETYYYDDDTRNFSFVYSFTDTYVDVYLEGQNLISVPDGYRLGQTFRFVVIPANLKVAVNSKKYDDVIKSLNIEESQIQDIKL